MGRFSASDAAVEGFHVLRREWRVVIGWAVFNVIALLAMVAVTVIVLLGLYGATGIGSSERSTQLAGLIGGLVTGLGTVATQVVILSALYRLMLRREAPGFLHLRIGREEGRVFLVLLVLMVGVAGLCALAAGLVAAASGISAKLAVGGGVGLAVVIYLLTVRFSLAPVASFATARINLVETWRITRGQSWALFGMGLLVACIVAVVAIAIWVALFIIGGVLTGFHDLGLSGQEALTAHPGRYVFQIVAEIILAPVFLVITQSPWVAAYKALSEPQAV
jgi:hypothetical protein